MKKNFTGEDKLLHDLNQLAAHTNEGDYKTRAAYKSHMRNFIRFYWREYHGQKLSNIEGKHIRAYAEYMKAQGLSPTTIKSRLLGIRFYQRKAGDKKTLPDNKNLGLEKRKVGRVDRAWTFAEVKAGMELAKNMGRMDVHIAIGIGYSFGLRIEEICRVRAEDVEKALANDGLRYKRAQEQYAKYEAEVRKDPKRMTSEILGHHRSDVTNTYLPELSPKQKK